MAVVEFLIFCFTLIFTSNHKYFFVVSLCILNQLYTP